MGIKPGEQCIELSIRNYVVIDHLSDFKDIGVVTLGNAGKLLPIDGDKLAVCVEAIRSRNYRDAARPDIKLRTGRDQNPVLAVTRSTCFGLSMVVFGNRQKIELGHISRMAERLIWRARTVAVGRVAMEIAEKHFSIGATIG